jgi:hypothetical protein
MLTSWHIWWARLFISLQTQDCKAFCIFCSTQDKGLSALHSSANILFPIRIWTGVTNEQQSLLRRYSHFILMFSFLLIGSVNLGFSCDMHHYKHPVCYKVFSVALLCMWLSHTDLYQWMLQRCCVYLNPDYKFFLLFWSLNILKLWEQFHIMYVWVILISYCILFCLKR